ncbi:AEC family transporter [Microbulbifer sp. CnH-101-G]|uniref:AEC family transporter n=1 Tax=Microbulbifer sp. CnH-101-G TaxID=3243393 RepID=UPI0040397409
MEVLTFALSVIVPTFLTMFAGFLFSHFRILEKRFVEEISRFIFRVTLPTLLFFNIYMSDAGLEEESLFLVVGVLGTLITIPIAWFFSLPVKRDDRSTFIHSSFRGNMVIVGLAWVESAYGITGLAQAELLIAFVSVVYNAASVIILTYYSKSRHFSWKLLLKEVGKNPLITSVMSALLLREIGVEFPEVVIEAGSEIGSITLPLALLCIGASFDFDQLRNSSSSAMGAVMIKLTLVPVVLVALGWLFRLEHHELGVLFLLAAVPSSSVCFIAAQGMDGNSSMAANIIGLSTLLSILTASFGLILLKVFFE